MRNTQRKFSQNSDMFDEEKALDIIYYLAAFEQDGMS